MAVEKYQRDDCASLAAGLAYFALFSFFPLLLVLLSLVGFVVDPDAVEVRQQLLRLIGTPELRELVTQTLEHLSENRLNAGLFGFVTLLVGATGMFDALNKALDRIWEVSPAQARSFRAAIGHALLERLVASGLVFCGALLILLAGLASLLLSLAASLSAWLPRSDLLVQLGQLAISLGVLSAALAALFRFLPDRRVRWGDVLPAAVTTAALFLALQAAVGAIFARINYASYGAVGGAMTLLLWIYLCCQVLLVGGELAYAWARVYGSLRD